MGCPVWGSNPSLLREKLQVFSSLSIVGCSSRVGCHGEIVSQPLLPILMFLFVCLFVVSFAQYIGITHLVFTVFSRVKFCTCSCWFNVSMGRGEVRIILCHHLELDTYRLIKSENYLNYLVLFFNNSNIKIFPIYSSFSFDSLLGNAYC